jgi:hypothetical protein
MWGHGSLSDGPVSQQRLTQVSCGCGCGLRAFSPFRLARAGASSCTPCVPGSYSAATGAGPFGRPSAMYKNVKIYSRRLEYTPHTHTHTHTATGPSVAACSHRGVRARPLALPDLSLSLSLSLSLYIYIYIYIYSFVSCMLRGFTSHVPAG